MTFAILERPGGGAYSYTRRGILPTYEHFDIVYRLTFHRARKGNLVNGEGSYHVWLTESETGRPLLHMNVLGV